MSSTASEALWHSPEYPALAMEVLRVVQVLQVQMVKIQEQQQLQAVLGQKQLNAQLAGMAQIAALSKEVLGTGVVEPQQSPRRTKRVTAWQKGFCSSKVTTELSQSPSLLKRCSRLERCQQETLSETEGGHLGRPDASLKLSPGLSRVGVKCVPSGSSLLPGKATDDWLTRSLTFRAAPSSPSSSFPVHGGKFWRNRRILGDRRCSDIRQLGGGGFCPASSSTESPATMMTGRSECSSNSDDHRSRFPPEALLEASQAGDSQRCLQVLRAANATIVNCKDSSGCTALHWAARTGSSEVTRAVLDHKDFCQPNAKSITGTTALHCAACSGHVAVCQVILAHPDFREHNAKTSCGSTCLHFAAWNGHAKVCSVILADARFLDRDAKDCRDRTALNCAEAYGHLEVGAVLADSVPVSVRVSF